ncbi:MAG: PD40 domain-containing protein [Chloroflexi bacterium]|nr:PD40 domain-containing protein [Chloroflexota bacterium]
MIRRLAAIVCVAIGSSVVLALASAAGRLFTSDSQVIAFSSGYDLWLTDLSRGITRALTRDGGRALDDAPAWSPDGSRLAFTTVRSNPYNPNLPNGEIAVMDIDGDNLRLLTRSRAWDDDPAWSPDGRTIAFRSNQDVESGTGVFLIDLDDPALASRKLIEDPRRSDLMPTWSPDGERIVMHYQVDGTVRIVSVDHIDGGVSVSLARTGYDPRLSPDGRLLAVWMPAPEGYVMSVGPVGQALEAMTRIFINPAPYTWSADSTMIAIAASERGQAMILLLDVDRRESRIALFAPDRVSGIAWRP